MRSFRLTDLQALMIFVGKNKAGRKTELMVCIHPRFELIRAYSTKDVVLNTDQLYIVISLLSVTTDLKQANKNRAYWKFGVNFRAQKVI